MTAASMLVKVEIDFVNGPWSATDTWTDVTADVTGTVEVAHGWSRLTNHVNPGTCRVTFFDPTRKYDPSNPAGPWAAQLNRRNKIRISARGGHQGGYTDVWRGYIERWEPDFGGPGGIAANRSTIEAVDIVGLLSADRLPESRWFQRATAQPGKSGWFRWREHGNTTVIVDHSGFVRNGVMKRQNADAPFTADMQPIPEVTVYDAFRATTGGIIPYGSSDDRAYDFAAAENLGARNYQYFNVASTIRPAQYFAHMESGLIGGTNWAVSMWLTARKGYAYDNAGARVSGLFGTTQPLFTIGVDNDLEYTFALWMGGAFGSLGWVYIPTGGVFVQHGPTYFAGFNDGLPHHIAIHSADVGGGLAVIILTVDGASFSLGNIGNHPGASQRIMINYPVPTYGQVSSTIGDVVFYSSGLPLADAYSMWHAGFDPDMLPAEQKSGFRINAALDTAGDGAGVPAALRLIDVGFTDFTPTIWNEAPIWDYCSRTALADGGRLFLDESGRILHRDRAFFVDDFVSNTSQFDLRDTGATAAGDIQTTDMTFGRGLSGLINDCRVNMDTGEFGENSSPSSIIAYGRRSTTLNAAVERGSDARNLATWIVENSAYPEVCIEQATVTALDTSSITALLGSARIGYRCTAVKTMAIGADLTCQALVSSKAWRFNDDGTYSCRIGFEEIPTDTGWRT